LKAARDLGAQYHPCLVIDASVALEWLEAGTQAAPAYALRVMRALPSQTVVPSIFGLEVTNAIVRRERKGVLGTEDAAAFFLLLGEIGIECDELPMWPPPPAIVDLSRRHGLTPYDASYLELAIRRRAPLATLDEALLRAAALEGVARFDPAGA